MGWDGCWRWGVEGVEWVLVLGGGGGRFGGGVSVVGML